jgi:hypothetical protein
MGQALGGADEYAAERGNEHSCAKKLSHAFPPAKEKAAFATTSKLLITYKYFEDCQFT